MVEWEKTLSPLFTFSPITPPDGYQKNDINPNAGIYAIDFVPGVFIFTCTVTDSHGLTDEAVIEVTVYSGKSSI